MSIVHVSAYLCGIFLLLAIFSSLITVAPGGELAIGALMTASVLGAVIFGGCAIWMARLPGSHWGRRSRTLYALFFAVAFIVTAFVLFGVLV